MTTHHKNRIHAFEDRAAYAPEDVLEHLAQGWRYIPVHPFANEAEVPPPHVDCWCLLNGDAALLECYASEHQSLKPGLYARLDANPPNWPKLHAVLTEPLTRAVVESTMEKFVELGFPNKLLSQLPAGDPLARIEP